RRRLLSSLATLLVAIDGDFQGSGTVTTATGGVSPKGPGISAEQRMRGHVRERESAPDRPSGRARRRRDRDGTASDLAVPARFQTRIRGLRRLCGRGRAYDHGTRPGLGALGVARLRCRRVPGGERTLRAPGTAGYPLSVG